jgi:hypothetical protein
MFDASNGVHLVSRSWRESEIFSGREDACDKVYLPLSSLIISCSPFSADTCMHIDVFCGCQMTGPTEYIHSSAMFIRCQHP